MNSFEYVNNHLILYIQIDRKMRKILNPPRNTWTQILQRPMIENRDLVPKVQDILDQVKMHGDSAIQRFSEQFDKITLKSFLVNQNEIEEAQELISHELKEAIQQAYKNIQIFHQSQVETIKKVETTPGVICWRKSVAIEKVGLYIPGGTAPLFSTVLMLAAPAQIAGCKRIILCSPPSSNGKIHPAILFAASICGVQEIYKIGGAQAIAAMAFGTESIPKVNKIFGPGNQFVTMAKMLVSTEGVAIDMPAGPSEVMVMADELANPCFIASDLLSQAEHGIDSQVVLICNTESIIDQTMIEIEKQISNHPRKETLKKSLEHAVYICLQNTQDMIDIANDYAPEHLIISMKDYEAISESIINAGSVFLGQFSPESAGDYASGTNHTLPTNGYAKAWGGVSLDSFVKKITFQQLSAQGLKNIGKVIETMAAAEGLESHKMAVSIRLKSLSA